MTVWDADPVWPRALARFYRWTERSIEQLVLATDRDTEIVDGLVPAWEAHRRQVATEAPLPRHDELDDFAAICSAESAARTLWATRVQLVSGTIALVVVAILSLIALALLETKRSWVDLAMGVVAAAAVVPLFVRIWIHARRWRRLRRRFRAPVPGRLRR